MSNDQPRADRWQELVALLGLSPPEEKTAPSDASSQAATGNAEAIAASPNEAASQDQRQAAGTAPPPPPMPPLEENRVVGIPIRTDWKRNRESRSWDMVAGSLGLAPTQEPAPQSAERQSASNQAATVGDEGVGKEPAVSAKKPHHADKKAHQPERSPRCDRPREAFEGINPICRTIEPPTLPEAEMVAVALSDTDAAVVEEKVVSAPPDYAEGLEVEQAVVAPPGLPASLFQPDLGPLEEAVGEFADESVTIAADTVNAATRPQESPSRRKRRRRRRKTAIAVTPEPFEAELPAIVAQAAAEGGAIDTDDSEALSAVGQSPAVGEASQTDAPPGRRQRERQRRPHESQSPAASESTPPEEEGSSRGEEGKSPHKAVPTWAETVGFVIQKNMENRRHRGNSGRGRDRS